jgi:hypothetical protein
MRASSVRRRTTVTVWALVSAEGVGVRSRCVNIRGDVLRANYGQNPWQERDQVITSVSWVSIVEDARDSLLRSRWD